MKRVLKWLGIGLLVLVGILVVGGLTLHFVGKSRLDKAPEVATKPVVVPTDAAAIARGEHLVTNVTFCSSCHGENFEGQLFFDGELGSYVFASNLTTGVGGVGATFTDADWERAIRHGIGADGRVLVIMPSQFYQHYNDEDLGAVVAYLKSVPPVDNDLGERRIGFPGSILGGTLGFNEFTHVNGIDHVNVGKVAPAEGVSAEYGEYMTQISACGECHGSDLAGITLAEGEDGPPEGPNLTPGGELANWTEQDFITALRTGQTPSGNQLDSEQMPWPQLGQMSDTELQAIWAYLNSVPAQPTNVATGG
jgi:cytochrome c553